MLADGICFLSWALGLAPGPCSEAEASALPLGHFREVQLGSAAWAGLRAEAGRLQGPQGGRGVLSGWVSWGDAANRVELKSLSWARPAVRLDGPYGSLPAQGTL